LEKLNHLPKQVLYLSYHSCFLSCTATLQDTLIMTFLHWKDNSQFILCICTARELC